VIYVDELANLGAPWRGGRSCHLMSDESERELLDFAQKIGLNLWWYQAKASLPHFDLGPGWRQKAISAGAVPLERREYVAAMRRLRAALQAKSA
jgi:Protein of unknown function (DUF4031)